MKSKSIYLINYFKKLVFFISFFTIWILAFFIGEYSYNKGTKDISYWEVFYTESIKKHDELKIYIDNKAESIK